MRKSKILAVTLTEPVASIKTRPWASFIDGCAEATIVVVLSLISSMAFASDESLGAAFGTYAASVAMFEYFSQSECRSKLEIRKPNTFGQTNLVKQMLMPYVSRVPDRLKPEFEKHLKILSDGHPEIPKAVRDLEKWAADTIPPRVGQCYFVLGALTHELGRTRRVFERELTQVNQAR